MFFSLRRRAGSPQRGACAEEAEAALRQCEKRYQALRVAMLSPEAERVLRYLVEVEELAEAVLSDKRQVRDAAAAAASSVRKRAGSRSEPDSRFPSALPLPLPQILTLCMRLPRHRFPNATQTPLVSQVAETRAAFGWAVG